LRRAARRGQPARRWRLDLVLGYNSPVAAP